MAPATPLVRPFTYFAGRRPSLARGLGSLVGVTVLGVAALAVVGGWLLAEAQGAIVVENPAYPGDVACGGGDATAGCDRPRELERSATAVLRERLGALALEVLATVTLGWIATAWLVHVGSWLAGSRGGPGPSVAVAAWGLVPVAAGLAFDAVAVAATVDPAAIATGVDPARGASAVLPTAVPVAAALWGGVVWYAGLRGARGLAWRRAALLAAVPTALALAVTA
jgi:hypothetical protein